MKRPGNEKTAGRVGNPFVVDQIPWRVTNSANNRAGGQVAPTGGPRLC